MTCHTLFSIATKEALHSFGYDDKKGYFVRKITNKLILILSEKRNKPIFCCLVHQVNFVTLSSQEFALQNAFHLNGLIKESSILYMFKDKEQVPRLEP